MNISRFSIPIILSVALITIILLATPRAQTVPANPSLTPPAGGPKNDVFKTLDQVEPRIEVNATNTPGNNTTQFKILSPGSYYLTKNITGVANKHGIEIAATGVTLDLNGFKLTGISTAMDGVYAESVNNCVVKNGIIQDWGGQGIQTGLSVAES